MRSMTGFGNASGEVYGQRYSIEIRSVNHRFLDLKLRLPPGSADPLIEQLLAQAVRRRLDRGSVVISLREEGHSVEQPAVRVDVGLARAHGKALRELAHALGLALPAHPHGHDTLPLTGVPPELSMQILSLVAAQPGVLLFGDRSIDPEARFQLLSPILEQALDALLACRLREGAALRDDLLARLAVLADHVGEVARLSEGAPEQQRRRLEERLARLTGPIEGAEAIDREARSAAVIDREARSAAVIDREARSAAVIDREARSAAVIDREARSAAVIDPQRLAQEVALLADRLDVSEEITRLRTHLMEFSRLCRADGNTGRRMDFLTQEVNREINTIGSKSQSAEVAARIVAMKAELERLREQIQNVE